MTPFGSDQDIIYMHKALAQARKAYKLNEVPIGAIVVNPDGVIIGRAHNRVEKLSSQTGHAELRAIAQAGKRIGDWRLDGHWIYVTLEPCSMCLGLIKLSRLEGVVFGAHSPLFGNHLDKGTPIPLYKRGALNVVSGVAAHEATQLLKAFFQEKRNKGG